MQEFFKQSGKQHDNTITQQQEALNNLNQKK